MRTRSLLVAPPLVAYALFAAADLAACLEPPRWLRGNTHAHTVLCGHADSAPAAVAAWYLDHGYHFAVLSEHNLFIDPATVPLPAERRPDFLLVPGEELTGPRGVHTSAVGIRAPLDGSAPKETPAAEVLARHVAATLDAGGVPILNHPNYRWGVRAEDVLAVERLQLFELSNGHPDVNDAGDATHPSTEALWDALLGAGRVVWGVASDDAHHFKGWAPDLSNPGRGWVVVQAPELTTEAIVEALSAGRFYASTGVALADLRTGPRWLELEVDADATCAELARGFVAGRAAPADATPGLTLEAIGREGRVLASQAGPRARFELPEGAPYLRVRATWTIVSEDGGRERYFAWTQPVFGDGR
jgi:hypothetical protein